MSQNYLPLGRHHLERINYYHAEGGANGYSQAIHHYQKLGECYSKAGLKQRSEAVALHDMYVEAGKLMEIMKKRSEDTSGEVQSASSPVERPGE